MSITELPLRVYVRQRVPEGVEGEFSKLVAALVGLARDEPGTRQYEWFYNENTRTAVTLEYYDDLVALTTHLTNADKPPVLKQIEPLVDLEHICVFGSLPDDQLAELQAAGMPVHTVEPWPGTARLNEAAPDQPGVQSYVEIELTDLEAYRVTSARIEAAAAEQPGILYHRSFGAGGQNVVVFEGYTDQDALLAWATSAAFADAAGDLGELIAGLTVEVFGDVTGPAKEVMDGWGAVYYERLAGFSRFNI